MTSIGVHLTVDRPVGIPHQKLGYDPRNLWTPAYGLTKFSDLFCTDRQLVALTTFSDLVPEARRKVLEDALAAGLTTDARLAGGRTGAEAYADAVVTYLGIGVSKATDYHRLLCAWRSDVKNEGVGHLFARQAIPMVLGLLRRQPTVFVVGDLRDQYTWIAKAVKRLPPGPDPTFPKRCCDA